MRTHFRAEQLADPSLAEAEKNLRACVHCGICTATCPTYVLLGDERDSPRGRIVMMQQMLEQGGAPTPETVHHLDRCLSCLGCRTACPSGVDYARLIDQSRVHIEQHYRRPLADRLLRWIIATVLTRPNLTRTALVLAFFFSPLIRLLPNRLKRIATKAQPLSSPACGRGGSSRGEARESVFARKSGETARGILARSIALLPGCVQQVIAPDIDAAAERLLARRGISPKPLQGSGCCGALPFHLGREDEAKRWATRTIEAFERAGGTEVFDGILITATGCAAHIADYPHLFRDDPRWYPRAQVVASKLVQFIDVVSNPPSREGVDNLRVALHVPCSLQHGLGGNDGGDVLKEAGFDVLTIPEGHLCCGSAGSYSILQPEIATALRQRKLENIRNLKPDVIATSNIGCLQHLSGPDAPPVVHIAELLDWAEGGPVPRAFGNRVQLMTPQEPAD
jgi:glycolate oxidase iron-sulfur subunit